MKFKIKFHVIRIYHKSTIDFYSLRCNCNTNNKDSVLRTRNIGRNQNPIHNTTFLLPISPIHSILTFERPGLILKPSFKMVGKKVNEKRSVDKLRTAIYSYMIDRRNRKNG
eukprot:TRINITY_DN7674_c0_g1_i3.p1 TRINITY_DN7674_c0_g1~~TRINITY_DN7674_c0_g1_i3.p1  ORF type:complete len:111 (-),score=7.12 TRINITY_DN7674_c0_g1_i3:517-849(-)